jgi:RNA polymerase sigma-70 factor, ECF subfamily
MKEPAALDEPVLRQFLKSDYPRIVAGLVLLCGSREAAEDVVQEALVRAWEHNARGEEINSLRAWTAVVALNLARTGLRRARASLRARGRVVSNLDREESESAAVDRHMDIIRAIRRLGPQQREAVALHYFSDLPLSEVAQIMNRDEGAVKALLHRARQNLAATLQSQPDVSSGGSGLWMKN